MNSSEIPAGADRRSLLISILTASFLAPFMGSSVNVALPSIGRVFHLSATGLSWVALAYMLPTAAFMVPSGRLGDMRGRGRIYTLGIGLFALSALACALSPRAGLFFLFRIFQGVGASAIFASGMALLVAAYPPSERGRILGLNTTVVYLGLTAGPSLGGLLVQSFGWRSIFTINGILGLLCLIFLRTSLPKDPPAISTRPFDYIGTLLYTLGLTGIMYGFSKITLPWARFLTLAGLIVFAVFLFWEKRSAAPLLEVRLFLKNRLFALSNLSALIQYSATFAVGFLMSLYLQVVKGYTPRIAGFILMTQSVMMALLSPFAGRWSDRIAPRIPTTLGQVICALGLFILSRVTPATPLIHLLPCLMMLGAGFALFSTPNNNAVMGSVERKDYGSASAIVQTMRLSGQMLSVGVAAFLLSAHLGMKAVSTLVIPEFMAAQKSVLLFFSGWCVLGAWASANRDKPESGKKE